MRTTASLLSSIVLLSLAAAGAACSSTNSGNNNGGGGGAAASGGGGNGGTGNIINVGGNGGNGTGGKLNQAPPCTNLDPNSDGDGDGFTPAAGDWCPCPSCPKELSPMHCTAPSARRPQMWLPPPTMDVMFAKPLTTCAVFVVTVDVP